MVVKVVSTETDGVHGQGTNCMTAQVVTSSIVHICNWNIFCVKVNFGLGSWHESRALMLLYDVLYA